LNMFKYATLAALAAAQSGASIADNN